MARPQVSPIPLDHPTLQRVRELIPPEHHRRSWVAGSAACRYPLNGDVDVWVTGLRLDGLDRLQTLFSVERQEGGFPVYEDWTNSVMIYAAEGIHILTTSHFI